MTLEPASLLLIALLAVAAALAGAAWARRRAGQRLERLAWRDPRTGLYSRAALLDAIGHQLALAGRQRYPVAVLLVEIDDYAGLVRQHGKSFGATVQQAVTGCLAGRVRSYDLLGQWGEARFLIALPDADVGSALVLAQDLRDAMGQCQLEAGGQSLRVTLSVGVHGCQPVERLWPREQALEMAAAAERALDATASAGPGRMEVEP